jgi:hypothetical protein
MKTWFWIWFLGTIEKWLFRNSSFATQKWKEMDRTIKIFLITAKRIIPGIPETALTNDKGFSSRCYSQLAVGTNGGRSRDRNRDCHGRFLGRTVKKKSKRRAGPDYSRFNNHQKELLL